LSQKGEKVGALRYMTIDVHQLVGVARLENSATLEGGAYEARRELGSPVPPPAPLPQPEKITVTAKVQCVFQIAEK
jgi:hypothetical protein